MAIAPESPAAVGTFTPGLRGFAESPAGRNLTLMVGASAVIAVMTAVWFWSQKPDYRVLFSNFSDRDGGAIVSSLQQMNVPYKFAEGGGAILVPADKVYDARLSLAAQGLPKGGNVGFELMENQKLGVSQFLEQVNFQRALEGELARSIQAVGSVQAARVHLALPKASVFVRERQQPTASVLLNLSQGRSLDRGQVSAIVHLVASSVPDLPAKNVTVVDQHGNLLSDNDRNALANGLDPSQLKYVQQLQQSIVRRIESIITPIVGPDNVHAEATADVDFSRVEQAAEIYKPNQTPDSSAIRSSQTSESRSAAGSGATGVPGALSNQPQAKAEAPIDGKPNAAAAAPGAENPPVNSQKDSTINYEVDKTIRYTQQPMGGLRRLSVAVVVNYKRVTDKTGKVSSVPLSEAEKTQITDLVKEAMGYDKERGDSLNVVNSPFAGVEEKPAPEVPLWKQPEMQDMAKIGSKYLLAGLVLLYLFFGVLRPMLKKLTQPPPLVLEGPAEEEDDVVKIGQARPMAQSRSYADNLEAAKQLAKQDPKIVANVVKSWMGNGND